MGKLIFAFCVLNRLMASELETTHRCEQSLDKLLAFCRKEGWAGYDPYDGLNSFSRALCPAIKDWPEPLDPVD